MPTDFYSFIVTHWKSGIEILILWIGIYQLYRAFQATQGARILVGLATILIVLTLLSQLLDLKVIGWILTYLTAFLAISLLIIFQPELRNALARLGSSRFFNFNESQQQAILETITDSVVALSKKRFGALIAIQQGIDLSEHAQTGVTLKAEVNQPLLLTLFHPKTALHDGGVIIANNRIHSAGCVFPVSQKELSNRAMGLRHRAAIGLTESTDALAIIVSEETGQISLSINGDIQRNLKGSQLLETLNQTLIQTNEKHPTQASSSELEA